MTLRAFIDSGIRWDDSNQISENQIAQQNYSRSRTIALTDGTGLNQANRVFADTRTLVATFEELDFSGGLVDWKGQTINATKLKGLRVTNLSLTDYLTVGGSATPVPIFDDPSDKIRVRPGGFFAVGGPDAAAYQILAGLLDKLKIDAGAATIQYEIEAILAQ